MKTSGKHGSKKPFSNTKKSIFEKKSGISTPKKARLKSIFLWRI
jgi:hypothetical protein